VFFRPRPVWFKMGGEMKDDPAATEIAVHVIAVTAIRGGEILPLIKKT
jgi:hypothetical protein